MYNVSYMKKGNLELVTALLSPMEVFTSALYLQFEKRVFFFLNKGI